MTTPDVDDLAQFIRSIDGRSSMGAGALAERICEWLAAQSRFSDEEVIALAALAQPAQAAPLIAIDPMQDPMRPGYFMNYAQDESEAEMVLRKLACWLGVGGYNAPTVDAKMFHEKIVSGVQSLMDATSAAQGLGLVRGPSLAAPAASGMTDAALMADAESALDLLALMFDAYEDGPACYEDPEERAGYLGDAVKLDHADVMRIADLLNRRRPRADVADSAAKKEGGAV